MKEGEREREREREREGNETDVKKDEYNSETVHEVVEWGNEGTIEKKKEKRRKKVQKR